MATAAMATAAGAAALLYYTLGRRSSLASQHEDAEETPQSSSSEQSRDISRKRVRLKPTRAPSTWFEVIATLSETLRFTYAETLGKWPIGDLAFGINFLMRRQDHLQVANIYVGEGSVQLKGPEVIAELRQLLNLLTTCIHFSKKPFPLFLEATGYTEDHVLFQEPKAGLLKPAFTILLDESSLCILLLIRGTHSVKDTLTAVTGAVVPFHHTVLDDGGVSSLVLGYAHCGMVAAARWIAQLATPVLLQALNDYPSYRIKVVGHSLGGGTAALLTYIFRERKEFSSSHCICFAPAACMTWELAESGKPFITTIINGSDLVPNFSAASIDDLRSEVTASAWVNDFREQIERIRFLKTILRSASALSSSLSSIASASRASLPRYPSLGDVAKARVASAWRPVSSGTQVVMKQAQSVAQAVVRTRPSLGLAGWSCMGARRRAGSSVFSSSADLHPSTSLTTETVEGEGFAEGKSRVSIGNDCLPASRIDDSLQDRGKKEERDCWMEEIRCTNCNQEHSWKGMKGEDVSEDNVGRDELMDQIPTDCIDGYRVENHRQDDYDDESITQQGVGDLSEEYLWHQLEQELERQREEHRLEREEEEEIARAITQEEENVAATAAEMGRDCIVTELEQGTTNGKEFNRFFPPGRIIHIISFAPEKDGTLTGENTDGLGTEERSRLQTGLFLTDRALYGKVHLSRTMINDHYMPNYKRMMESLIEDFRKETFGECSKDITNLTS